MSKPVIVVPEQQMLRTVRKHQGVAKHAAEELGISTSTLLIKLRERGYQRVIRWEKPAQKVASHE